jgi:cytochrome c oxidase assembly protein subunit 15
MPSRLPHRLAWILVCVTFPLLWMGGMVTTYGAGMAVPDWPSTFGWWWYPVRNWANVWDVFLEHSHRVIGMTVGLATISLAVSLWRCDPRRWVRWLGLAAIGGVCLQGTLGGLRVIADARLLAAVHGCTAPLFFSLAATLVIVTSPQWQSATAAERNPAAGRLQRVSFLVAALVYLQILLGAQLRHVRPDQAIFWHTLWVWLHVLNAALLVAFVVALLRSAGAAEPMLRRRSWLTAILCGLQLVLGAGTWITHYGWPAWFRIYVGTPDYTVGAEGPLQVLFTTTHVVAGSLALVAALSVVLWSQRLVVSSETAATAVGERQ